MPSVANAQIQSGQEHGADFKKQFATARLNGLVSHLLSESDFALIPPSRADSGDQGMFTSSAVKSPAELPAGRICLPLEELFSLVKLFQVEGAHSTTKNLTLSDSDLEKIKSFMERVGQEHTRIFGKPTRGGVNLTISEENMENFNAINKALYDLMLKTRKQ